MMNNYVKICASGEIILKDNIQSIEGIFLRMIEESKSEIVITVYSISPGANSIIEKIVERLNEGVKVILIINKIDEDDRRIDNRVITELKNLSKNNGKLELYDFKYNKGDLHAKLVMVDKQKAIIGSANLSHNGFLKNQELAVYLEGEAVNKINTVVNNMLKSKYLVRI